MQDLLTTNRDFDGDIFRNIVSLRKTENLFDDLTDDPELLNIAVAAEMRVKQASPPGVIERGFHYSVAIAYPFETDKALATRYSNSEIKTWYGSLDLKTTVYETAFHSLKAELGIEGASDEIIIRERAVYNVHCRALLIDLVNKQKRYPDLVAQDYHFTQQLGFRIASEGHPGLLAPSVRNKDNGINAVIFKERVLSNPRVQCYLTYSLDVKNRAVKVERTQGKTWLQLEF